MPTENKIQHPVLPETGFDTIENRWPMYAIKVGDSVFVPDRVDKSREETLAAFRRHAQFGVVPDFDAIGGTENGVSGMRVWRIA